MKDNKSLMHKGVLYMFKAVTYKDDGSIRGFRKDLNEYLRIKVTKENNYFSVGKQIYFNKERLDYKDGDGTTVVIKSKHVPIAITDCSISVIAILPLNSAENTNKDKLKLTYAIKNKKSNIYSKDKIEWLRGQNPANKFFVKNKKILGVIDNQKLEDFCILFFNFIEESCPRKALGWNESCYMGITKKSYFLNTVKVINPKTKKEFLEDYNDAYKNSLKLLSLADPSVTYPIFSYVLLSFANVLLKKYRQNGNKYFIGISGGNSSFTSASIANIFANFSANPKRYNSLPKEDCINIKTTNKKSINDILILANDYPIIFTSTNTISIKQCQKMLNLIEDQSLSDFLIFITPKLIDGDFAYSLDLNGMNTKDVSSELERYIYGWHVIIEKFVEYIELLQDLCPPHHDLGLSNLEKYWEQIEENTAPPSEITSENWFSFSVDLNFAFHLFIGFGLKNEYISNNDAETLKTQATDVFKSMAIEENLPLSFKDEDIFIKFKEYIENIFIHCSYSPEYENWPAEKSKGVNEPHFCLEYKYYFDDFCKMKEIFISPDSTSKHKFEQSLLTKGWIQTRNRDILCKSCTSPNTKSDTSCKGTKFSVLVVLKNNIMES